MRGLLAAAAARVGSAADVGLARCRAMAIAVRVEPAADVAPEDGQLAPELAQKLWRGGPAALARLRGAPRGGEQDGQEEQRGGTANEESRHDGLLSGGTAALQPPWQSRPVPSAYGARFLPGKVQTKGPEGDIPPGGGQ